MVFHLKKQNPCRRENNAIGTAQRRCRQRAAEQNVGPLPRAALGSHRANTVTFESRQLLQLPVVAGAEPRRVLPPVLFHDGLQDRHLDLGGGLDAHEAVFPAGDWLREQKQRHVSAGELHRHSWLSGPPITAIRGDGMTAGGVITCPPAPTPRTVTSRPRSS